LTHHPCAHLVPANGIGYSMGGLDIDTFLRDTFPAISGGE